MNSTLNQERPRLKPIENPKSLKLKLAYWFMEKQMGKVPTPTKVGLARFPEAIGVSSKLARLEGKFTIDPKLNQLLKVYVATINGCAFCVDIAKAIGQKENNFDPRMFDDLLRFEESDSYTDAQKAALTYVDEATRKKQVTDATFEKLRQHFSEREIVEITFLNAIENFYNLTNIPLNIGSDELCALMTSN